MSKFRISIEGKTYEMEVEMLSSSGAFAQPVNNPVSYTSTTPVEFSKPLAVSSGSVVAPMPGRIIKILKNKGDEVRTGDIVLILEAMKMENEITSPISGIVASLNCTEGCSVAGGVVLFEVN